MKFVIFHGAYGSKDGNWFPYLKTELQKLNQDVILEQFPIENWDKVIKTGDSYVPKNQNLNNWLNTFEKKILPKINKKDKLCFIGHSAAPVFILHLIERYKLKLDSAIFVMPFMEPLKKENAWMFDLVNKSFYKKDFDFMQLKINVPLSYTVYSDNDQFVEEKLMTDFALKMKSEKILIKGGEHLNGQRFSKMPLILELCKSRLDPKIYL